MFTFIVTDKVGSPPVQDFACHAVEFNSENSRGHSECLSIESLMGVFSEKRPKEGRVKKQEDSRRLGQQFQKRLTEENLIIEYMSGGGQALKTLITGSPGPRNWLRGKPQVLTLLPGFYCPSPCDSKGRVGDLGGTHNLLFYL